MSRRHRARIVPVLLGLLLLLGITACAQVQVKTLPPPPPTAKLRVFFLPVSDALTGRQFWSVSHREYARNMARPLMRYLRATGIYAMVPQRDVDAALKGQNPERIVWQRSDWEAAKKVGRAVHADYVVITHRGYQGFFYFQMLWINLETGRVFESKGHPGTFLQGTGHRDEFRKIIGQTYREVFQQAKADLLATAIRKGRTMERMGPPKGAPERPPAPGVAPPARPPVQKTPPPVVAEKPTSVRTQESGAAERPVAPAPAAPVVARVEVSPPSPPVVETPKPPASAPPSAPKPAAPVLARVEAPPPPPAQPLEPVEEDEETPESAPQAATARVSTPPSPPAASPAPARRPMPTMATVTAGGKTRLVVYDLETTQTMQVAGLIITEALREEILKLGSFDLVNREDLSRAMEELKLQQSGLVQEKESVQMGRWLAARESVTGRLGALGSTTVLSTKRTDIETMGTLSIGSIKAPAGREEDLLNGLPELAKKLTKKQ